MQFDRTHVVVRPRSASELFDLSLLVLRRYFVPLSIAFATGAVPFAIINFLLIGWLPLDIGADDDAETIGLRWQYIIWMSALIFLETPLAGIFATSYVGQAVFQQKPSWRQVRDDVKNVAVRVIIALGFLRGPLVAIGLILWIDWIESSDAWITFFLIILAMYAAAVRSARPNLPEILLLERCPILAGRERSLTAGHRSQLLHAPVGGESISRFVISGMICFGLTLSLFFFMIFVQGVFAQRWSFNVIAQSVYVPLAMWIVAGYCVIFRFLCYLDNRIRLEGWDVELAMRAEAIRQFGEPNSRTIAEGSPS
ncbi:MAG: hypothetical protein R3C05_03330 [Pirellulaceae bacterium]